MLDSHVSGSRSGMHGDTIALPAQLSTADTKRPSAPGSGLQWPSRKTITSPREDLGAQVLGRRAPPASVLATTRISRNRLPSSGIEPSFEASSATTISKSMLSFASKQDATVFPSRSPSLCAAITMLARMALWSPLKGVVRGWSGVNDSEQRAIAWPRREAAGSLTASANQAPAWLLRVREKAGPLRQLFATTDPPLLAGPAHGGTWPGRPSKSEYPHRL